MNELNATYWDDRYKNSQTGWDLGELSPPLKALIDKLDNKNPDILIPGCGNAYEAQYLIDSGFTSVTVLDISPTLTDALRERWKNEKAVNICCEDFFRHEGTYDLILEQTFFCALEPSMREDYMRKMKSLLKVNGKLAGVLFGREFEKTGPPFGGNRESYFQDFSKYFEKVKIEACMNSALPRQGTELFFEVS